MSRRNCCLSSGESAVSWRVCPTHARARRVYIGASVTVFRRGVTDRQGVNGKPMDPISGRQKIARRKGALPVSQSRAWCCDILIVIIAFTIQQMCKQHELQRLSLRNNPQKKKTKLRGSCDIQQCRNSDTSNRENGPQYYLRDFLLQKGCG